MSIGLLSFDMAHGSKSRKFQKRAVNPFGGLALLAQKSEATNLLPQTSVDDAHLTPLMSLSAILSGDGTAEHVGAIALACNVVGALIRQGLIADGEALAVDIVERCQTALLNADRRFNTHRAWGFSMPEVDHVREMLTMHERMIASATTAQMRAALADIDARVRRGEVLQSASVREELEKAA